MISELGGGEEILPRLIFHINDDLHAWFKEVVDTVERDGLMEQYQQAIRRMPWMNIVMLGNDVTMTTTEAAQFGKYCSILEEQMTGALILTEFGDDKVKGEQIIDSLRAQKAEISRAMAETYTDDVWTQAMTRLLTGLTQMYGMPLPSALNALVTTSMTGRGWSRDVAESWVRDFFKNNAIGEF